MNFSVSSIYNNNEECCGPKYAIDRVFSFHPSYGYFVSNYQLNPWFMITFDEKILLEKVLIQGSLIAYKVLYEAPFKNISVRAGPSVFKGPTDGRKILDNYDCKQNEKIGGWGKWYSFECKYTVEAKVITIQRTSDSKVILVFDEVEIIGKGKYSTILICLD